MRIYGVVVGACCYCMVEVGHKSHIDPDPGVSPVVMELVIRSTGWDDCCWVWSAGRCYILGSGESDMLAGRAAIGTIVEDVPGYSSGWTGFVNVVGPGDEMRVGLEEEVVGNCCWSMQLFGRQGTG